MKEAIEHHKALRTLANIITDMYGFQPQAEPDAEKALRQALHKHAMMQEESFRKIVREEITLHEEDEKDILYQNALEIGSAIALNEELEAPIQVGELVALKDTNGFWWFNAEKLKDGYQLEDTIVQYEKGIDTIVRMTKVIEMLNNEV